VDSSLEKKKRKRNCILEHRAEKKNQVEESQGFSGRRAGQSFFYLDEISREKLMTRGPSGSSEKRVNNSDLKG